jgi:AraC-like DNA-binding protein
MEESTILSLPEYFEFTSRIRMRSSKKEKHYHSHWEIYYLVEGVCSFFIDDKSYRLTAGDVALFPPGIIHKANYETPTFSRLLIYCDSALIPPSAEPVIRRFPVYPRDEGTCGPIQAVFETIRRECTQPDAFSGDLLRSKLTELLTLIARGSQTARQPQGENSVVEQAVGYIRSRYMEPISLGDVAGHCFVSREHLSRIFKRETGLNLSEYLMIYRLQKAESLLRQTPGLRVAEVAQRCGFNDSNYFSKSFRKLYGYAPTALKGRMQ